MVDEFSGFTKGVVLKDKEAETVVYALVKNWGYFSGLPKKSFHADNGGEFQMRI